MLTITSLLSILFLTFHLAGDIVYGWEPGGLANLIVVVLVSVVWLYGTLVLAERRSGYIIMFLLSLFSLVVPYVHMKGKGVGVTSRLAGTSGHFFSSGRCSRSACSGSSPPSSRRADCGVCHGAGPGSAKNLNLERARRLVFELAATLTLPGRFAGVAPPET